MVNNWCFFLIRLMASGTTCTIRITHYKYYASTFFSRCYVAKTRCWRMRLERNSRRSPTSDQLFDSRLNTQRRPEEEFATHLCVISVHTEESPSRVKWSNWTGRRPSASWPASWCCCPSCHGRNLLRPWSSSFACATPQKFLSSCALCLETLGKRIILYLILLIIVTCHKRRRDVRKEQPRGFNSRLYSCVVFYIESTRNWTCCVNYTNRLVNQVRFTTFRSIKSSF